MPGPCRPSLVLVAAFAVVGTGSLAATPPTVVAQAPGRQAGRAAMQVLASVPGYGLPGGAARTSAVARDPYDGLLHPMVPVDGPSQVVLSVPLADLRPDETLDAAYGYELTNQLRLWDGTYPRVQIATQLIIADAPTSTVPVSVLSPWQERSFTLDLEHHVTTADRVRAARPALAGSRFLNLVATASSPRWSGPTAGIGWGVPDPTGGPRPIVTSRCRRGRAVLDLGGADAVPIVRARARAGRRLVGSASGARVRSIRLRPAATRRSRLTVETTDRMGVVVSRTAQLVGCRPKRLRWRLVRGPRAIRDCVLRPGTPAVGRPQLPAGSPVPCRITGEAELGTLSVVRARTGAFRGQAPIVMRDDAGSQGQFPSSGGWFPTVRAIGDLLDPVSTRTAGPSAIPVPRSLPERAWVPVYAVPVDVRPGDVVTADGRLDVSLAAALARNRHCGAMVSGQLALARAARAPWIGGRVVVLTGSTAENLGGRDTSLGYRSRATASLPFVGRAVVPAGSGGSPPSRAYVVLYGYAFTSDQRAGDAPCAPSTPTAVTAGSASATVSSATRTGNGSGGLVGDLLDSLTRR